MLPGGKKIFDLRGLILAARIAPNLLGRMVKRYELTDEQWNQICEVLPGKSGDPGRSGRDNRLFVDAVLWVLRSGARWSDLPERYGKYKTAHKRFSRWAKTGVWERVFELLTTDRKNEYLMLDTTLVRAHRAAARHQPLEGFHWPANSAF